eukprot:CAMPEP_0181338010 /NCGR_PEP_ID=MMETSP1101-20121128/28384_1 /TAXON_ID=46948 /ORGANISM="Rhodomonas abbreviata, Strain Caron Lab Isolate" /LENGTH=81 /DNA_ID=CAMNT_0023448663 /DNA_START=2060 /DNA_END=2305 /DNA_ORIENTATION=-
MPSTLNIIGRVIASFRRTGLLSSRDKPAESSSNCGNLSHGLVMPMLLLALTNAHRNFVMVAHEMPLTFKCWKNKHKPRACE